MTIDSTGRTRRRIAIVVANGGYLVAALAWSLSGGLRTTAVQVAVVTGFAAAFGALAWLMRQPSYWTWANAPDAALDEYQIASRNLAYRYGYMAISVIGMLGILAATIVADAGERRLAPATGQLLFWGWLLVTLTLPSAILAWTERPLDAD